MSNVPDKVTENIYMDQIKVRYRKTEEGDYRSSRSFDLVIVRIPIISYDRDRKEILQYLNDNRKELDEIAINSIEKSSRFKKSGLSINYFELDSLTLTKKTELEYVFGIKKSILKLLEG